MSATIWRKHYYSLCAKSVIFNLWSTDPWKGGGVRKDLKKCYDLNPELSLESPWAWSLATKGIVGSLVEENVGNHCAMQLLPNEWRIRTPI